MCTGPVSNRVPRYLCVVVVVGVVETVDNPCPAWSARLFYPPRLWAAAVDNQALLWTPSRCAQPVPRNPAVFPTAVPRKHPRCPQPSGHRRVTAFTRAGEEGFRLAEQWTSLWATCVQPTTACGQPVDNDIPGRAPASLSPACVRQLATNPHPLDLRVSLHPGRPVDQALDNSGVPRLWKEHTSSIVWTSALPQDVVRSVLCPGDRPGGGPSPGGGPKRPEQAKGACGRSVPRTPLSTAGGRDQVLMRLVSSVTWL